MRARSGSLGAATALLAMAALAGCTGDSTSPAIPADLRLARHTWGGLCPGGPCRTDLVIDATGHWTFDTESDHRTGTVSTADLATLANAIQRTNLLGAKGRVTCAADLDGTSVRYAWKASGVQHAVSSCEQPVDAADPLVIELENVARSASR